MERPRILVLILFLIFFSGVTRSYAHKDYDDRHKSDTEDYNWFCPWCIEDPGYNGINNGINGYQNYRYLYDKEFKKRFPELEEPLTIDKVQLVVDNYISLLGIPDLKSGKITDKGNEFDADIITKDGSLLETLIIDKQTGVIKSCK